MRIFVVLVSLFFPFLVFAQSVFINEIAWMGTPVAGIEEKQWWRYEWIELYNAGDAVGMLDGWTVELSREKIDFKVFLSGTITANGYFLVGASDKILGLDFNYKNLGGKFNNSGQRVVLKNKLGEIIDEVDAQNGWPAGDNKTKQTMERSAKGGSDPPPDIWQTSKELGGTPKAPNSKGVLSLNVNSSGNKVNLNRIKDGTEKDLSQSFQSRVPIVNPITLLAGFLALGFSGVLLLVKRSLASRQARLRSMQERQQVYPERSRRT